MDINFLQKRIKDLCDQHHISIDKMLKECNLKPSVVDNIKKGSIPAVDKVLIIAEYFNVSIYYLLGLDDVPNRNLKVGILNENADYDNCYVACLDILGFSEYVKNGSFIDVWAIFETYFSIEKNMSTAPMGTAFTTEEMSKLKFNLISDTIVISIKKSENRSLEMLVFAVDIIIHNIMLNSCLPVRGAISEGNFYSNDIDICFWGEALINAHELEKYKSVYPRVIIPPEIFKEYEESVSGDDKKYINYLVKLDPVKLDRFYIVNYVRYILDRLAVNDEDTEKTRKKWDDLISDYENKITSLENPHICNKYLYFAKYYNIELFCPSEFIYYKSRKIKCQYNDFFEEQSTQFELSKDRQRLLNMYNQLNDMEKGEILGELKTLTRERIDKEISDHINNTKEVVNPFRKPTNTD